MHAFLLTWVIAASPLKIAVMPLQPGEGVGEKVAAAMTEAVVGEIRHRPDVTVITPDELQAVLTLERQKALMGCSEQACLVELSSAAGVDQLVAGSVSKLGASWLVHLKRIEASSARGLVQSDRRLKDKSIDDVLDELPAMVAEVFGGATHNPTPQLSSQSSKKSGSGGRDVPFELGVYRSKLVVLTDGKGHLITLVPFALGDSPVFAGDGGRQYAQRVVGGGRNGQESFSLTFWDPRAGDGWRRSLSFQKGSYKLQCGDKEVAYQSASKKVTEEVLSKSTFLQHRWRRMLRAAARDDNGQYYLVDAPLEGEQGSLRLFVGPKGKLEEREVREVLDDPAGQLLLSAEGKLRLSADGKVAEWLQANSKITLTRLPIEPRTSLLAYGELGVYRDDPLRTACDPHW